MARLRQRELTSDDYDHAQTIAASVNLIMALVAERRRGFLSRDFFYRLPEATMERGGSHAATPAGRATAPNWRHCST
jgi:hypothetical protein